MGSADRWLVLKIATSGTITLPDCTGPTGATYFIRNSGSGNVTLRSAAAAQPIADYASGITLKPGQVVTMADTSNARAVSGCSWSVAP